jgi:DnaJ-domain-containing protein 1
VSKIVSSLIAEGASPPEYKSADWRELVQRISEEKGYRICGVRKRSKTSGTGGWPCEDKCTIGRDQCRRHGSSNARGADSNFFKHGRYSKVLEGTSLQDSYQDARNDPELLALTEEIAVDVARLQELFAKLNKGEAANVWENALASIIAFRKALVQGITGEELVARVDNLQMLFTNGINEYSAWDEIMRVQTHVRKLVVAENKHRESMQYFITVERAQVMNAIWLEAVRRIVPKQLMEPLLRELQQLQEANGPQRSGGNPNRLPREVSRQ